MAFVRERKLVRVRRSALILALDGGRALAVGSNGAVVSYDGSNWAPGAPPSANWLYGVGSARRVVSGRLWVAGGSGTIMQLNGGTR